MSAQSDWENAEASANAIPADFIDLDAYPLDGRDPRGYAAAVGSAKDQLAADVCCVLPGFVRALALPILSMRRMPPPVMHTGPSTARTPIFPRMIRACPPRTRGAVSMTGPMPSCRRIISAPTVGFARSMSTHLSRTLFARLLGLRIFSAMPTRLPM